jgi:hypothetical protein
VSVKSQDTSRPGRDIGGGIIINERGSNLKSYLHLAYGDQGFHFEAVLPKDPIMQSLPLPGDAAKSFTIYLYPYGWQDPPTRPSITASAAKTAGSKPSLQKITRAPSSHTLMNVQLPSSHNSNSVNQILPFRIGAWMKLRKPSRLSKFIKYLTFGTFFML